jgi:hypothetical protein
MAALGRVQKAWLTPGTLLPPLEQRDFPPVNGKYIRLNPAVPSCLNL